MKTTALALSAALLSVLAAAGPAAAQDRVVNVYNWSDYIEPSILEDFTRETGIRVVYDVYDSNEILETRLFAGSSGYDVVVPSGEYLIRQIEAGIFQELDRSRLPNLPNMWDFVAERAAVYDPGNAYSVNYMWGTTGIGYNVGLVADRLPNAPTDSWALVFDPQNAAALADCGIYLLDSPTELVPPALAYLGLDPDSREADDLAQAEELLRAIRPHVRRFHSSEYINALANGDICVAVGFSGDVFQARDRAEEAGNGVEIAYSIPREGALMFFDQMAIPADAPHVAEAHEFIDFMMRPEIIARATNYVSYANGNEASQPLIEPSIRSDPSVYPNEETLAKLFTRQPYDARTQRTVTRMWQSLKTGQ